MINTTRNEGPADSLGRPVDENTPHFFSPNTILSSSFNLDRT